MLKPDIPDLGGGHRHRDLALYLLDLGDQILHARPAIEHRAPVQRFVTDDDAVDVAVALGELDGGFHLPLILLLPLVDPGAERDMQSEFGCQLRHGREPVADAIGADRARVRRDHREIGPDLLLGGDVLLAIMSRGNRRERNARKLPHHVGRRDPIMQKIPARCMQEGRKGDHEDDTDTAHFWESFSLIRPARSKVRA